MNQATMFWGIQQGREEFPERRTNARDLNQQNHSINI